MQNFHSSSSEKERPTFLGEPPSINEPLRKFLAPASALYKRIKENPSWSVFKEQQTLGLMKQTLLRLPLLVWMISLRLLVEILDPALLFTQLLFRYLKETLFGHTTIYSQYFHLYEGLSYAASPFFNAVEEEIKAREMPERIRFKRIRLWEGSIWSPRRLYMKIRRKGFVIYLCGAPYGKSYFFSYYVARTRNPLVTLLYKLLSLTPLIGQTLAKQIDFNTFYRFDTAQAFSISMHQSIQNVIKAITEEKGLRALTPEEQQPTFNNPFKR